MLTNEGWTEERTEELRGLWNSGFSCVDIAAKLEVTKNSVVGKANRLGLEKRRDGTLSAKRPVRKREKRQLRPRFKRHSDLFSLFETATPLPDFIGIQFVETDQTTCMYPEGDGKMMLFCGQPRRDESSYCAGHRAICHQRATGPTTRYWKTWGRAA